jgi:hypothetical protein
MVLNQVTLISDRPKLFGYQLPRRIPPTCYSRVDQLNMLWRKELNLIRFYRYLKYWHIPCHYMVMKQVTLISDMLNLFGYQLLRRIPPTCYSRVDQLTLFWRKELNLIRFYRYVKYWHIPCHYMVMNQVTLISDRLNLFGYQLPRRIPPTCYSRVHQLNMLWRKELNLIRFYRYL